VHSLIAFAQSTSFLFLHISHTIGTITNAELARRKESVPSAVETCVEIDSRGEAMFFHPVSDCKFINGWSHYRFEILGRVIE
jgi:hypothetical protein